MKHIFLFEKYRKMTWEVITSNSNKRKEGERLIEIVRNAYRNTKMGSFINTKKDVLKSDWYIIDCDDEEDIDGCIFYRKPRNGENWRGRKIQGIGHDGEYTSKKLVLDKLVNILSEHGNWVEASGTLEQILINRDVVKITDERVLNRLFPNSEIIMLNDNGKYRRRLSNAIWVEETSFGNPVF